MSPGVACKQRLSPTRQSGSFYTVQAVLFSKKVLTSLGRDLILDAYVVAFVKRSLGHPCRKAHHTRQVVVFDGLLGWAA